MKQLISNPHQVNIQEKFTKICSTHFGINTAMKYLYYARIRVAKTKLHQIIHYRRINISTYHKVNLGLMK